MMKRIRYIILTMAAILSVSCMKDGEMLIATLDRESGSEIMTPDGDLVLSIDKATSLALTLYWDETGNIVLNNPDAQVGDDAVINAVQFSADESFSIVEEISVAAGQYSLQLICSELNGILSRLGYEAGVQAPLYMRIRTALGENTGSLYGAVLEINVTSYYVDWSFVRLIETGDIAPDFTAFATLPATGEDGDGEYAGFVNVPNDWYNFYFMEGDNSIYGTENDGSKGTAFSLETTTDIYHWGCWFPEGQTPTDTEAYACWYVTMDRADMEWSAMRIRSMWLQYGEGENDNAQFEYNSGNTAWRAVFTTPAANTEVQLDEWGTLYNRTTGEAKPVDTEFTLIAAGDGSHTQGTLSIGAPNASTGLVIPEAGTYTLILRLADMTWELLEGEQEIPVDWPEDSGYEVPGTENVFIYSLSGEIPSSTAGKLAKGAGNVYNGFCNLTTGYTFKFGDDEDPASAAHVYGSAPVANSEEANYRLHSGADMYPISYLGSGNAYSYVTADFDRRNWSSVPVESVTLNLSGTEITMAVSANTGVYTAESEISSWGDGIRFLVNGETLSYTDNDTDGTLSAGNGYFTPSTAAEDGHEYRITLDLNAMTYEITDITGEAGPVYPEMLYAIYTWDSGWPLEDIAEDAAVFYPAEATGTYTGFFSSGSSWGTLTNYIFCTASRSSINIGTIDEEKRYGNSTDMVLQEKTAANKDDGIGACWLTGNLGLYLFNVNLANMTFSREFLGTNIHAVVNDTETAMAFNTTTLMWEATVSIAAGSSLTFRLDNDGKYVYGGADGSLAKNGAGITVAEDGQYLVTVDLRDYKSLKYSLTKQE